MRTLAPKLGAKNWTSIKQRPLKYEEQDNFIVLEESVKRIGEEVDDIHLL